MIWQINTWYNIPSGKVCLFPKGKAFIAYISTNHQSQIIRGALIDFRMGIIIFANTQRFVALHSIGHFPANLKIQVLIMLHKYLNFFTPLKLKETYDEMKTKRVTTGTDHISKKKFEKISDDVFSNLYVNIKNGSYHPNPYREVLLIKNRNSKPRALSLPTIRDKIILAVLRKILHERFKPFLKQNTVADIIKEVSDTVKSNKYNYYIKIDISNYYGSINHKLLLSKVINIVKDQDIVDIINLFLKNVNISENAQKSRYNSKGVPQGISISNILGNIYLNEFDKEMGRNRNYKYFRYVDDILIFCTDQDFEALYTKIKKSLKSDYHLTTNSKKLKHGIIENIDFLGYHINSSGSVGISDNNIKKIERSLDNIFGQYMTSQDSRIRNNINLLKWKIDFRITGCIKDDRRYGWVIFFRLNENETIMHHLDWYIVKLIKKYKLDKQLLTNNKYNGKKFVKTYLEFKNKQNNTEYIPNINNFTKAYKQKLLIDVCKRNHKYIMSLNNYFLDREFQRFAFSSIRDLEMDLHQIYT